MAALPTIGSDPESQKEYTDALNSLMQSLTNRATEGTNLYNVAAGFLAPTRSGGFSESLGNAAGAAGKDMQRQEEQAIPLAQMRAQIAGQKLEIANKNKAYGLLGGVMGVQDPTAMAKMVASGQLAPGMGLRFTPELYLALQQLDPKMAEGVKNAAGMDVDRYKLWQADMERGLKEDELVAKYGSGVVRNYKALPFGLPAPSGTEAQANKPMSFDFSPLGTGTWSLTSAEGRRTINGVVSDHGSAWDVGGVKIGTPANSPVSGEVVDVGNNKTMGNFVRIRTPDGNVLTAAHWDKLNVAKGDQVEAGKTTLGLVGQTGNATGPHIHFEYRDSKNNPTSLSSLFKPVIATGGQRPQQAQAPQASEAAPQVDMTPKAGGEVVPVVINGQTYPIEIPKGTVLADRGTFIENATKDLREQIRAAGEGRTADFKPRIAELSAIDPGRLENANIKYERLAQLASKKGMDKALGMLYEQGAFTALATAAQTGVKLGNFGLSVDIYEALKKLNLPPELQKDIREMEMILADVFIDRAKSSKSAFGPQISNADILFMQAPMASVRDPQKLVLGFAQQEVLKNKQLMDLGNAYGGWLDSVQGTNKSSSQFFRTKEYTTINKQYADGFRELNNRLNYR
jgi:murein DD-endopeptidase MepM/ murein hydrolase activator NlpD